MSSYLADPGWGTWKRYCIIFHMKSCMRSLNALMNLAPWNRESQMIPSMIGWGLYEGKKETTHKHV